MSEMKHTPTPWKIKRENVICDANGDLIATLGYNNCVGDDKDDCAHIVACVNAISAASEYSVRNGGNPLKDPSDLVQWTESTFVLHGEMTRQQARAEERGADNARLREALQAMLEAYAPHAQRSADANGEDFLHSAVKLARAALARTEGE